MMGSYFDISCIYGRKLTLLCDLLAFGWWILAVYNISLFLYFFISEKMIDKKILMASPCTADHLNSCPNGSCVGNVILWRMRLIPYHFISFILHPVHCYRSMCFWFSSLFVFIAVLLFPFLFYPAVVSECCECNF
jgi:hypothetical protein